MKHHAIFASAFFAIIASLLIVPASAAVQIIGSGKAHDCFLAAKSGVNPGAGIPICDDALTDESLSQHDRAATLVNRGVMKIALGQVDDAMRDYNAGIALLPNLGDAYDDRGAALITLKRYDEALADINKGIDMGMSYPQIGYFNRGIAEELMGQFKASYLDFKHVLQLEPDFAQATEQLKNFTVTSGNPS